MGKIATIARRTFLIGAAAVVGGVAIGYVAYKRDPENPLLDDLGEGEATLNPYVRIDADGVTLITPRADKGQGAVSIQAALIAEEMDLAWGDFKTDFGVPSAAYYNGKVAVEGFPIAATSDTIAGAGAGRQAGDVIAQAHGHADHRRLVHRGRRFRQDARGRRGGAPDAADGGGAANAAWRWPSSQRRTAR